MRREAARNLSLARRSKGDVGGLLNNSQPLTARRFQTSGTAQMSPMVDRDGERALHAEALCDPVTDTRIAPVRGLHILARDRAVRLRGVS
jgi:hypothetical protein